MTLTDDERRMRLFGTDEVVDPPVRLRAGPLTATLDGDQLRWIAWDGVELLRGIAFLVRDEDWGTAPNRFAPPDIVQDEEGFRVRIDARTEMPGGALVSRSEIVGDAAGRLTFTVHAHAEAAFTTNRAGFVVLHPLEGVVGRPMRVRDQSGAWRDAAFPDRVDPVQPATGLTAIAHVPRPGLEAICEMVDETDPSETWEMEDQRNWTDASLKTYVRPLAKPRPYRVPADARIVQRIAVTVRAEDPSTVAVSDPAPLALRLVKGGAMPEIGLVVEDHEAAAASALAPPLRETGLGRLVCRLWPETQATSARMTAAFADFASLCEGRGARCRLDIVVPSGVVPSDALDAVAAAAREAGLVPDTVLACREADLKTVMPGGHGPDVPSQDAIYEAARKAFPQATLLGGGVSYFTEFNRQRPPVDKIDGIAFATSAIVHAADDASVMETLQALPDIVRSASAIAPDRPIALGPAAIGLPHNPYGAAPLPNPNGVRTPMARRDPRQTALFNAAWTLGYAARVAGKVHALVLQAPTGDLGLFDDDGMPRPVFYVAQALARAEGSTRILDSSTPDRLAVLGWRRDGRGEAWLANLTDTSMTVSLDDFASPETVHVLDAEACESGGPRAAAPSNRLTLDAYALAALTF